MSREASVYQGRRAAQLPWCIAPVYQLETKELTDPLARLFEPDSAQGGRMQTEAEAGQTEQKHLSVESTLWNQLFLWLEQMNPVNSPLYIKHQYACFVENTRTLNP